MDTGSYLAQPPLMLTTLEAADGFYDPLNYVPLTAEGAVPPSEPISSVRVRVAAADEPTATVQARIERVAADIAVATGLDVDVTPGSSPTAVAIELPPGDFGRPQLTMLEDWTRKGVSFDVIAGLDRRSFALAVMIQVVAGLFVANAAPAGVRSRRSEFATLCAVGWSARLVFVSVAAELGVIGVGAGLLGVVLAVGGLFAVGLPVDVGVTAAVVPLAIALAAGLAAARAAARIPPAAALRPPVRGPETVQPVRGLLGMAWRHVMRFAGRSVLGGVSLAISVAGLTALLAITLSYQELLIDSRLGLALADQVRPSDLAVAVLAVLFGAAAVAQVVFLNLREREVELAILRALGWTPRTVRRLSFLEGLLIALGGVLAGGAAGIGTAALDGGADALGPGLAAAGAAAACGLVVSAGSTVAVLTWVTGGSVVSHLRGRG